MFMMEGQQGECALYHFLHIPRAGWKEEQNTCTECKLVKKSQIELEWSKP